MAVARSSSGGVTKSKGKGQFRVFSSPLTMHYKAFAAKGIIRSPITSCSRRDHSVAAAFAAYVIGQEGGDVSAQRGRSVIYDCLVTALPKKRTNPPARKLYMPYDCFLWSPYVIGQTIIFFPVISIFFFLFFPRLISAVGDWMSTILPHMVWP